MNLDKFDVDDSSIAHPENPGRTSSAMILDAKREKEYKRKQAPEAFIP